MLQSISKTELPHSNRRMEQIWRFRHSQFVDRLGWEDIRQPDGREIDQFDTDVAIHLPLVDDDEVVGYSRLLPTEAPHLLSDVYPELMDGDAWPRGPTVYEWTRCIASDLAAPIAGVPASNILMTAVVEYCLVAGISMLIVETHPKLVNLLLSTGWDVTPLAAPSTFKGSLLVPISALPSAMTLATHHQTYGINGSLLDLHSGERNPLDIGRQLLRLPYLQTTHVGGAAGLRRVS
jgi:acyl-homoserine lactone synthase